MEHNPTPEHGLMMQQSSHKTRRWPWVLGIMALAFCHVTFFLPFRAFVPVSPGTDPWWGMGLILADGTVCVMLLRMALRTVMQMKAQKMEE